MLKEIILATLEGFWPPSFIDYLLSLAFSPIHILHKMHQWLQQALGIVVDTDNQSGCLLSGVWPRIVCRACKGIIATETLPRTADLWTSLACVLLMKLLRWFHWRINKFLSGVYHSHFRTCTATRLQKPFVVWVHLILYTMTIRYWSHFHKYLHEK